MKRVHVHVSVKDPPLSIRFYRTLFGAARMVEVNEQPRFYAKSHEYWVTDPPGIAWEAFHTLGRIPVYGEDSAEFNYGESTVPVEVPTFGCCVPAQRVRPATCQAK